MRHLLRELTELLAACVPNDLIEKKQTRVIKQNIKTIIMR